MNSKEFLNEYDSNAVEELIAAVIELNLTVPVNIDNNINRKLNRVESALKALGVNPRKRR